MEDLKEYKNDLISSTFLFFQKNFDLSLFLKLLDNKDFNQNQFEKIIQNFPNLKCEDIRNKIFIFKKDSLDFLQKDYKNKFLIIYSVISDTTEELRDIKEEDGLNILFDYNEKNKVYKIPIKKNFFSFFIKKLSNIEYIKKLCHNCNSVSLLFECLFEFRASKNIKDLTINDLPEPNNAENILDLIEKYEKIKGFFKENEINKLWRKYISLYNSEQKQGSIQKFQKIKEKFESTNNNQFYKNIIKELSDNIDNLRKKAITSKDLKGKELYKFINNNKRNCDFFSDENIILDISKKIDLKELEKDNEALEEFKNCKFLKIIDEKNINSFIHGIIDSIISFEDLYIFFKIIFPIGDKAQDFSIKNTIISELIISHFFLILNKNSNYKIKFKDEYQEVVQRIILLSVMYIEDDKENDYRNLISKLGNCSAFDRDDLIKFFIHKIINSNIEKYISLEKKNSVSTHILQEFYFRLNIEKKILFLSEFESLDFKEQNIYKENIPKIDFDDVLNIEDTESFIYLQNFIKSGIIKSDKSSSFFKDLISICNSIYEKLEKKMINFSDINKLKILIDNKKLSNRINYLCLCDESKSVYLQDIINNYVKNYINYYYSITTLIKYYNKYFQNTKRNEINEFSRQQLKFKQSNQNLNDINIDNNYNDEIKKFEKYEKSKFFNVFYNDTDMNIKDKNNEINKYNKAVEVLDKCKNLLNNQKLDISFLEKALSKFEDYNSLLNEIKYLKEYFDQKEANENIVVEKLTFYKNRKKIIEALNGLIFISKEFLIKNIDNIINDITQIIDKINKIHEFQEISDILRTLKNIDENILEKDFIEILCIFNRKNHILFNFLNSKKEEETRDLIDGLYDDNDDDNSIEIKDIEILINGVCFIKEIKNKTNDIKIFLFNFHDIIKSKQLYKEIISNLNHIETKIDEFEQYITIQYGKNVKNSNNIDKFLQNGFIKFEKKNKEEEIFELYKQNSNQDQYIASIRIGDKDLNFEEFKKIIKKMMTKNIYTYGKKGNNFKKVRKIAELINGILYELNINTNLKFNKTYEVLSLEIIDKTIIKIPQLEKDLNDLRNMNSQIKKKNFEELSNNPSLQYLNNFDLYDLDFNNNKKNIENYFPNFNELNNKSNINSKIHYNISCNSCDMNPIIGIRYKCKICNNFNYCEKCMEIKIKSHIHEFTKIENPIDSNDAYNIMPSFLSIFLLLTRVKKEYSVYKGLFFYKTSKDDYELDILKIFNKFLKNCDFCLLNDKYPASFYKKLPFHYNLLLCYEDFSESTIYSFCARAINCIDNCLFVIVRPEEMTLSSEKFFFKTFNRLLEAKKNDLKSCIIILYINQASHIIKQLKKIKEKYGFPEEPPVFNQIEKTNISNLKNLSIEIITSDSPRVGKTTYIAKKINKNNAIFSFSLGNIDKKLLSYFINQIKSSKKKKISIIFQLYQNQEDNSYLLIRSFLFKFLILKYYDKYNYILDDNISIYIEISSDYCNFNKDFKILDLFKRKKINFKNNKNFYEEYENKILTGGHNYFKIRRILTYLNFLKNGEINSSSFFFKIFKEIKSYLLADSQFDEIIKTFFIEKFSSNKILPNYGQIQMFINLLNDLIFHFEKNKDMDPDILKKEIKANNKFEILKSIREKIIGNYVDLVVKFSSMSYESILENQEVAAINQKDIEYKLTQEYKSRLIDQLNKKRIISYKEIKPSIVLFNNNIDNKAIKYLGNCSIICKKDQEEYKQLKVLYCDYLQEQLDLQPFDDKELTKGYYIRELNNICITSDKKQKEIVNEEKLKDYEFTCDNYIKMILIYLRIRANIPVILLGETGCGKTSLIKALSYFLEDEYKLIEFNIHSGISYEDILLFLYKNNLLKEKKDEEEDKLFGLIRETEEEEKFEVIGDIKEKKILFIDEINTTNSLNLLVDLFTNKSFIGNSLKDNVYVIGECNPYRLMLSKNEEIGYTNKKRHHIRNLIYTVNPLPLSLINYIFDFGNLREEEEKKYINSFIQSFLSNSFSQGENNVKIYDNIFEIICDSVYECQTFIRDNSEISSVSLREIQRFKKFFEFFLDITSQEKEFNPKNVSEDKNQEQNKDDIKKEILKYLKAANLSLYVCYYLRIINHKKREELVKKLEAILKFPFLDYPYKLENKIADNMNLNKGIAKNRALLDNIFTLFVCLNVKIPIFICGKAGCSKTLSFSLLYQSMKGEYSDSELFKKYPKLYVNSYQGSLTSNSLEIQTIFKRAKNVARNIKKNGEKNKNEEKDKREENKEKNNSKAKILSVILFDEMGLAELSPNNPLKVIHAELDNNNNEIGFVGISNWSLDASKMNRGVHLSNPEPNKEDLKYTAITIATGIYEEIGTILPFKKIIQNLAESYFDYKQYLYQKYLTSYDFHGARDFYFLIKIAARILKSNISEQSPESIAMESIERNFGGLELDTKWNSTKKFKQIFSGYQENVESIDKYDVFSCVQKNIEEENNRYLLLITDRTKNDTLIEYILKKLKLNYRFIQGSKLKEDQNEGYVLQKAWSVISSMEKGEIIILKDMEILYPKFYDLFNQNLQKYGNSLDAKIVLDSTTNERHIVNEKFRCIILLEKNNVDEQDPPFLNRFEKHLISFKYILTEKQNLIAKELFEEIRDLTTIPENKNILPLLININIEEIRCLILEISMGGKDIEKNLYQIYKFLIPTFSQENVLCSLFSQEKKYIKKDEIIQIYEENSHTNVYKFLENVKKNKLIIYTFSPYYKDLFNENEDINIENKNFGNICIENTLEFTFNEKLSENMLNYFFELYYEKKNCNLFVVHFKVKDSKFIKYIKFQLDDYHKKVKEDEKKIFLFIIHIKKNKSAEYLEKYYSFFFSFLSEYQQITIDNLTEQKNISIINLFKKTNEELLVIKELLDVNLIIKKEFSRQIIQINSNENNSFIDKLDNLSDNGLLESIIKNIQNSIKNSENILRRILIDYSDLKDKDYDFISYFVEKIEKLISDNVSKLIRELAENGYLVSFMFEKEIPKEIKKTILSFIDNINLRNTSLDNNLNYYMLDLKIPGSKLLFRKFFSLVQNFKNDYINKEDEYRKKPKKKDENTKIKEITLEDVHFDKKQYLKNRLWNEELLSEEIFNLYYIELIKDFMHLLFYNKENNSKISKKQEEFLLFLYQEKNKNDNLLDRFLYFFLWVICYQETIFKFLEIIDILDKYFISNNGSKNKDKNDIPELLQTLKSIYDSVEFPEEEDNEKKKK